MFQVGERALAEDDVVGARPHQILDRRMRLEELLGVLVGVKRPAPAQVEFQEGGKVTVVQQGCDIGGVADEMWQMKDLRVQSLGYVRSTIVSTKTDLQIRAGQQGVTEGMSVFFIPRHSGQHCRLEVRELPKHLGLTIVRDKDSLGHCG